MSSGPGVQFSIYTAEAVASLVALRKELNKTLMAMGGGSAPQLSKLTKDLKQVESATKSATQSTKEHGKALTDNVKTALSWSEKMHGVNVRYSGSVITSNDAAQAAMKQTQMVMMDPSSWLYQQKKMVADAKAASEWSLLRRAKANAVSDWDNKTRKEDLARLKADIIQRSFAETSAYAFRQEEFAAHLAKMTALSSGDRAKELAALKKGMIEYSAERSKHNEKVKRDTLSQYAALERAKANHLAELQRQEQKAMAFRESSLQSQISKINKILALQRSGKFSDAAIVDRHGLEAVGAIQNLPELQKQLAVQKAMEKVERDAERTRNKGTASVNANTAALRANAAAMHNARGAARGLSGSLGQLWMTYGAVAPLVAGAALGTLARQTYAIGKDVEYRLKMIEALGNRAVKIEEMMPAVHGSMMTPLQAAEGLQELAQAGLNADESLAVLGTTLQLATLGGMSVSEAAITATAAISTFHLEVSEASRVGDVFAKTASVSNTTVMGVAEAMRQAGSAASIYGVTLEETAAQIAIMAQNGIRGSAAGTAVRNAMTELHAPTEKARELMEKFGIEMYKEGNVTRNYMDVLEDLRSVYYSLDEAGQNALLKGMFNERSRRAIQIYMQDLDNLKSLFGEITDSQLFLLDANLKLLSTVEGASNRMSSVFQQSLVKSFDNLQPIIISTIRSLEELFDSRGFQVTVETLGGAIARLTKGLSDHMGILMAVGTAYAAHRVTLGLLSASYGLLQAAKERNNVSTARTIAMTELETAAAARNAKANTVAGAAAATRTSRLIAMGTTITRVTTFVGWATLAVSAGVSLWNAWSSATDKSASSQEKLEPRLEDVLKVIQSQNEELEKQIKLQKELGEGKPEGSSNFEKAIGGREDETREATDRLAAVRMEIATIRGELRRIKEGGSSLMEGNLQAMLHDLEWESGKLAETIKKNDDLIRASKEGLDAIGRNSQEAEANRIRNSIDASIREAEMRVKHGKDISDAYKKSIASIVEYYEKFKESGENSKEALEALSIVINDMLGSAQKNLNSFDGSALEPWIQSQIKASEGSKNLSNAILKGSEAVTKYNIEQEAQRQTLEFTQKSNENYETILRQVTDALWAAHYAESSLNAVRQISNIQERTRELQEQLGVLRTYTQGAKEFAKAEADLAYNQSKRQVLEGVAPGDQPSVAMTHLLAWEEFKAAEDDVKTQQALNRAFDEGLSSLDQYTRKRQELIDLREKATTDEDRAIVTKRLIKLEEDYQKSLNKGGGRAARQIERLDVWIAKKYAEAEATKDLTNAYLGGEASLLEYNIQKEASVKAQDYVNQKSEEYKKIVDQIKEAVRTLNTEQARLEIAKQVNDLNKQTKASDDYVKVLLAQSKGYKQGEVALKAFNKEQARTALLANLSADNLDDVLDILAEFDAAYDRNDASGDRNKKLEDLNDLVNQTKNSTQKYREEMEKLEDLIPTAETPEQVAALAQAIRNLEIEASDFLSTFNQGFVDLNQNASDMWRKFLEDGTFSMNSVKSLFRNMLADLAHQALTKPIIISIQNAVMGTNVGGGWGDVWGGSGGSGGSGGLGSLVTLASGAKNLWGAFSGGLNSAVAQGVNSLGSLFGTSSLNSFAAGLTATGSIIGASAVPLGGIGALGGLSSSAALAGTVGTGAIANSAGSVALGSGAGLGSAVGTALPYIGAALAAVSIGKMVHNMFKGETRSGGGFHRSGGETSFVGGPSGGYGGSQVLNSVDQLLASATASVDGLFEALDIAAEVGSFYGSFESSGKGRGGTQSGGTLNIDGQAISFGVSGKGSGYGGTSGTAEEMFENMTKDMNFSILEAWQLASDQMPGMIQNMLSDLDVRSMDPDAAGNLAQEIYGIVQTVNTLSDALELMPFENLKNQTFDLNHALIETAGGIDNLMGGLNFFYENFYDEQERFTHLSDQLNRAFEDLGHSVPDTKDAYRSLMEAQDVSTESGRELYTALLNLAPTFVDVQQRAIELGEAAEDLADDLMSATDIARQRADLEKQIMQMTGDVAGLRALEIKGIHESNRALQERIWILQDARSATDSALSAVQRLGQEEIARLKQSSSVTDKAFANYERLSNKIIGDFKSILDAVSGTVEGLRRVKPERDVTYQAALRQINEASRTGNVSNTEQLLKAINTVGQGAVSGSFGSLYEANRERLLAASRIEELNKVVKPQLSAAERALETAQDQLNVLRNTYIETENINLALSKFWTAVDQETSANRQIQIIENQLEWAERQYNELRGVNEKLTDFNSALSALSQAISKERSAKSEVDRLSADGSSSEFSREQQYLLNNPDVAKAYREGVGGGMSASELARYHYSVYGQFEGRTFAKGGYYSGGLALVGEEGPELINFSNPGQVYTNDQTMSILHQGTNQKHFAEMVSELRNLRQEVSELRREQNHANFQQVKNGMKIVNNTEDLVRLNKSGDSLKGTVVTYP